MGAVHRTATKSLGRPHPVHVKRMSTYDKLVADMELEKHKRADKDLNDHVADVTTKKVLDLANNYADLLVQLDTAVLEASQDYTDVLNMKDGPEIGEGLFDAVLTGMLLIAPELGAIREAMMFTKETVESATKISGGVAKLFDAKGDPNIVAKMRIVAARNFLTKIDTARAATRKVFSEVNDMIVAWKFKPEGNLVHKVREKLKTLKIGFDLPQGMPYETTMFTDFFLYDMVGAYVKAAVALNYNTDSSNFPGGVGTHLKPEDHYFDEAGGKYVWVEGLKEESFKAICEMLGKDSKHAMSLIRTGRRPVSRPGDLVTVWGAEFVRNSSAETENASGSWLNKNEVEREQRKVAAGWR